MLAMLMAGFIGVALSSALIEWLGLDETADLYVIARVLSYRAYRNGLDVRQAPGLVGIQTINSAGLYGGG
jgi:hypothetical protein